MEWLAAFFQILNVTPTDSKLMLATVQRRTMTSRDPFPSHASAKNGKANYEVARADALARSWGGVFGED